MACTKPNSTTALFVLIRVMRVDRFLRRNKRSTRITRINTNKKGKNIASRPLSQCALNRLHSQQYRNANHNRHD